jgi:hypothetical protein
MLSKILVGVAVLVVLFVLVVATRPATFRIERSLSMAAPPDRAFAQVNDFHAWRAWSPWEGKDPGLKRNYSGAPAGVGAVYAWAGNPEVGEGRMTIQSSTPSSAVVIQLEFIKPFAATNQATFTFAPEGPGTRVTWAMDGHLNFMMKAFHLFVNMDQLVGADFEQGLAQMRTLAETAPPSTRALANAR